jgi:DNA-binding XRE family transcriptional regulator
LSIEALGAEAGVDWTSVSRIERGKQRPTWETTIKLATALGVEIVELAQLACEKAATEK